MPKAVAQGTGDEVQAGRWRYGGRHHAAANIVARALHPSCFVRHKAAHLPPEHAHIPRTMAALQLPPLLLHFRERPNIVACFCVCVCVVTGKPGWGHPPQPGPPCALPAAPQSRRGCRRCRAARRAAARGSGPSRGRGRRAAGPGAGGGGAGGRERGRPSAGQVWRGGRRPWAGRIGMGPCACVPVCGVWPSVSPNRTGPSALCSRPAGHARLMRSSHRPCGSHARARHDQSLSTTHCAAVAEATDGLWHCVY